ncbi:MAG: Ig-like domain-containing protein [Sumerlaeia bacterium]
MALWSRFAPALLAAGMAVSLCGTGNQAHAAFGIRPEVIDPLLGRTPGGTDVNSDGVLDAADAVAFQIAATPTPTPTPTPTATPTPTSSPTPTPTPLPLASTSLTATDPGDGEGNVSVSRETVLRFSAPLDPATITSAAIYARNGSDRLPARLHVSPDGQTVTLFYQQQLPANTRVRVTIDGDLLRDAEGNPVDSTGDGLVSGPRSIRFDTQSLTVIPGTVVVGRVFASELEQGTGGEPMTLNRPLEGVRIFVQGAEDTIATTTDDMGNFRLEGAPTGPFFAYIDGRTVTADPDGNPTMFPQGPYYPFVGKRWQADPGVETVIGDIYLPLIEPGALQVVSDTADTAVGFPQAVLDEFPGYAGVGITVPADSLYDDDGSRGGRVGLAPVPPDRLPEPLPEGLDFPVVITVQTDGPQNFDVPAPVCFPNLPSPATGETLAPGEKSGLWSFDHDLGLFRLVGSMTVSEDGSLICSDPGVGILEPGWHGSAPGSGPQPGPGPGGPGGGQGDGDNNGDDEDDLYCDLAVANAAADCTLGMIPGLNCVEGIVGNATSAARNCSADISQNGGATAGGCGWALTKGAIGSVIGCAISSTPIVGQLWNAFDCLDNVRQAIAACGGRKGLSESELARLDAEIAFLQTQLGIIATAIQSFYGDREWLEEVAIEDRMKMMVLAEAFDAAQDGPDMEATPITAEEAAAILALDLPAHITPAIVQARIDRWNRTLDYWGNGWISVDDIPPGMNTDFIDLADFEARLVALDNAAQAILDRWGSGGGSSLKGAQDQGTLGEAVRRGLYSVIEDLQETLIEPSQDARYKPYYVVLRNVDNRSAPPIRAYNEFGGTPLNLVLPADTNFIASWLDPVTFFTVSAPVHTAGSGELTSIPALLYEPSTEPDSDGDGLPDDAEFIVGTLANDPDSDGDGISDAAEVQQGLDPAEISSLPVGIVASVDTPGNVFEAATSDGRVFLIDKKAGLLIFNAFGGMAPQLVGQVALPATPQVLAADRRRAAAGVGGAGLSLIDSSGVSGDRIIHQISTSTMGSASVTSLAVRGDRVYAGTNRGTIHAVDFASGQIVQTLTVGQQQVRDVTISRGLLYAREGTDIHVLLLDPVLEVVSTFPGLRNDAGVGSLGRARIRTDGTLLATTFSKGYNLFTLANPLEPVLADQPETDAFGWLDSYPDGNGFGVVATGPNSTADGPHNVDLYDWSNPTDSEKPLTSFVTPGIARGIALANGLIYVADGEAGLQVIRYLEPDLGDTPPVLTLDTNFAVKGANPQVEERSPVRIRALVSDDVQVRNVEFHRDGILRLTDGTAPYEYEFRAPFASAQSTFTFHVRAVDTGGNATVSETSTVGVTDDVFAPQLLFTLPADESVITTTVSGLTAIFNEPLQGADIQPGAVEVRGQGPDGTFDTGDDGFAAVASVDASALSGTLAIGLEDPLLFGIYRVTLPAGIRDQAGNALADPIIWTFEYRDVNGPVIAWRNPEPSASVSNPLSRIQAGFNEPVVPASLGNISFSLVRDGADRSTGTADDILVPGTLGYEASLNAIVFDFAANPVRNDRVRAVLGGTASDLAGNVRAISSTWNLTAGNPNPPNVTSIAPEGFVSAVTRVEAVFPQALDPASVNLNSFQLFNAGADGVLHSADDTPVRTGVAGYEEATRTAFMSFPGALPTGEYRVSLQEPLAYANGNPTGAALEWSFTAYQLNLASTVTGRLILEDDNSAAPGVELALRIPSLEAEFVMGTSDASGVFTFTQVPSEFGDVKLVVNDEIDGATLAATLDPFPVVAGGTTDLGDVVLRPLCPEQFTPGRFPLPNPLDIVRAIHPYEFDGEPVLVVGTDNYTWAWDGRDYRPFGLTSTAGIQDFAVADLGGGEALYALGALRNGGRGILKWDPAEERWTLAPGLIGLGLPPTEMVAHDDGSGVALFIGGTGFTINSTFYRGVAKYDGATLTPVGGEFGHSVPASLRIEDLESFDGDLYVSGWIESIGGQPIAGIAKWDGASWTNLGSGLAGFTSTSGIRAGAYDLDVWDDGSGPALFAAGNFDMAGGNPANNIAKWNGLTWSALGGGTNALIRQIAETNIGGSNRLAAIGTFTMVDGETTQKVAYWNGSDWIAEPAVVISTAVFDSGVTAMESYDPGGDERLYIGGSMQGPEELRWRYLGSWDGTESLPVGRGVNDTVHGLFAWDDGGGDDLYVTGEFIHAGQEASAFVARWDGTDFDPIGGFQFERRGQFRGNCFAAFDDGLTETLYLGGAFDLLGSDEPSNSIARWDGTVWQSVGGGLGQSGDTVNAMLVFDDGSGPALYVAGDFDKVGGPNGIDAVGIARWNGFEWSGVGGGMGSGGVGNEFTIFDAGNGPELYIGGRFTEIGGKAILALARWDGSQWRGVDGGVVANTVANTAVSALAVYDSGAGPELVVSGTFNRAGGLNFAGMARWNGSRWTDVGGQNQTATAFHVFDNEEGPELYAVGSLFLLPVGTAINGARWNGTEWKSVLGTTGMRFSDSAFAMETYDSGDGPGLVFGGKFISVDGFVSPFLAEWKRPARPCP